MRIFKKSDSLVKLLLQRSKWSMASSTVVICDMIYFQLKVACRRFNPRSCFSLLKNNMMNTVFQLSVWKGKAPDVRWSFQVQISQWGWYCNSHLLNDKLLTGSPSPPPPPPPPLPPPPRQQSVMTPAALLFTLKCRRAVHQIFTAKFN